MRELRTQIDASAPIFSQIRAYVMAEGDTFSYQTFDGNIEKQKFKAWTQRMEVQTDLPPQQLQAEMEKKFREMTEAAGRHFETSLFDTVREATEKTGMGFDAGGKPFHPSMLWDMLERMDVDFDTNGEPVMPTLVVHPDMFKAIEKKIPEWESDPELQKRRNGVLAKKKGEWLDREARRKLLDNVNERGYEAAFCQALSARGYRIVHRSSHGPMEQGKDVIAIAQTGEVCAYQLKTGNIDQRLWREITGEVVNLVESAILHPNIRPEVRFKPYLVTNGQITDAVRLDIFAKNAAWRARDREPLQLILKDELFEWFVTLQGRFLPTTPVDFQRFLSLYLAEKRDLLDKAAFCEFLESFLPIDEEVKRSEIRRVFAATAVIANYILSGFQLAKNHLAVAEGWMIVIAYLLRIAESFKAYRRLWEPSLELCISAMDAALEDLAEEALASKHFIQGDPSVDLRLVPLRTTMVLGWLAGFSMYKRLNGCVHSREFDMYAKILDNFNPHQLAFWGETASPCFLAMALLVWSYGREGRACRMAASIVRTISEANKHGQAVGLPDAYFQPQELVEAFVKGETPFGYRQSFTGRSQSIQTFIEFIARRQRKKILEQQWYGICDIDPAEFVPTNPVDIYRWRCKKGDSQTRKWSRPQEWSALLDIAEQKQTPALLLCSAYPELLPLFFLVFPHRMPPHLSRFLDHKVMDCVLD